MKVIIAPDKFKGSLSSMQACDAIAAGILQVHPGAEVVRLPMADGGDGFADVMSHYLHTTQVNCETFDPLMRPIIAIYQWDETNKTAIIELAAASGLMLLNADEKNPLNTTTFGTGVMIKHAINKGALKILLGIGGSATNDAGLGILAALGFQLTDVNGQLLSPVGKHLQNLANIVAPLIIPSIQFDIACDVQNVLFGRQGAACVYAPQKGADEKDTLILDKGLQHVAELVKSLTQKDIASFSGAGAAGGVSAGLSAWFNIKILAGASLVAKAANITDALKGADYIFTGEGKLDEQSSRGKVIHHIAALGRQHQIPVFAVCGTVSLDKKMINAMGLAKAAGITSNKFPDPAAMENAAVLVTQATARLVKALQ